MKYLTATTETLILTESVEQKIVEESTTHDDRRLHSALCKIGNRLPDTQCTNSPMDPTLTPEEAQNWKKMIDYMQESLLPL